MYPMCTPGKSLSRDIALSSLRVYTIDTTNAKKKIYIYRVYVCLVNCKIVLEELKKK